MARNLDDVFQRDLKAFTFPRAFAIWTLTSLFFYSVSIAGRRLIPIGRYGVRKINETQFYQNFGWLGVATVAAGVSSCAYIWWRSTLFMGNKFYSHVLKQNRSWIHESL